MARQLVRDVIPELESVACRLFLVSIGTAETGMKFSELTGFPSDRLFADPDNAAYDALKFNQGPLVTYISPVTPVAIGRRALRTGLQDLKDTLKDWVPWQPPRGVGQASIQGGTLIFDGKECVWSHYDKATADHANFDTVLEVVRSAKLVK